LPQQLVQAIHAAHEAGIHLSQEHSQTSSVVVCAVPSEQDLLKAHDFITRRGIRSVVFTEPDIGGQATALASEPVFGSARRIFNRFSLWKGDLK
jgi:hypothetical protein